MKLKSRIAAPNRPFLFLIHVAAPIVLGSGIYVLVRSPHLRCFGWLRAAGLSDSVAAARMAAEPLSGYVPSWFLYSLPDSLWTYALTSVMLMLWYGRASVFKPLWLGAGPICGIGSELGQLVGLVRGTFDTADLLLNTLAAGTAILVVVFNLRSLHEPTLGVRPCLVDFRPACSR